MSIGIEVGSLALTGLLMAGPVARESARHHDASGRPGAG